MRNYLLLSLLISCLALPAQNLQYELSQIYHSSEWYDSERKDYSYTANNHLRQTNFKVWNQVMWYQRLQEIRYTRPNGLIDSIVMMDSTQRIFELSYYHYNSNGNLDSVRKKAAYGNRPLRFYERTTYRYDSAGNQIEILTSFHRSGAWQLMEKIEQSFNRQGRLLRQKFYLMDFNGWILDEEAVYEYDLVGRKTTEALLNFLGDTIYSLDYFFGSNGLTSYAEFYLHTSQGPQLVGRQDYSWNGNGDLDTLTNLVLDPRDSSIVPQMRWIYGYSPYVSLTESIASMEWSVYPNPVQDWLNLEVKDWEGTRISLWRLDGTKLGSYPLNQAKARISLAHLPKGIYLISWENRGHTFKRRIVKQ
jgi:hypothetical protein